MAFSHKLLWFSYHPDFFGVQWQYFYNEWLRCNYTSVETLWSRQDCLKGQRGKQLQDLCGLFLFSSCHVAGVMGSPDGWWGCGAWKDRMRGTVWCVLVHKHGFIRQENKRTLWVLVSGHPNKSYCHTVHCAEVKTNYNYLQNTKIKLPCRRRKYRYPVTA